MLCVRVLYEKSKFPFIQTLTRNFKYPDTREGGSGVLLEVYKNETNFYCIVKATSII